MNVESDLDEIPSTFSQPKGSVPGSSASCRSLSEYFVTTSVGQTRDNGNSRPSTSAFETGQRFMESPTEILGDLQADLLRIIAELPQVDSQLRALAKKIGPLVQAISIWRCLPPAEPDATSEISDLLADSDEPIVIQTINPRIVTCINELESQCRNLHRMKIQSVGIDGYIAIGVPVFYLGAQPITLICLVKQKGRLDMTEACLLLLSSFSTLGQVNQKSADGALSEKYLQFVSASTKDIITSSTLSEAAAQLATRISNQIKVPHAAIISIGLRGKVTVAAVSGATEVDQTGRVGLSLIEAIEEVKIKDQDFYRWSTVGDESTYDKFLVGVGQAFNAKGVWVSRITLDGHTRGFLVLAGDERLVQDEWLQQFGPILSVSNNQILSAIKIHQAGFQKIVETPWLFLRRWKLCVAAAILVLVGIAFIPMSYTMRCDCNLETTKKRYFVAPYTGALETVWVQPGEPVKIGQLLATMDDRELKIELAGKQSEFDRESKKTQSARANGDQAESNIARLESQRIAKEIELIQHRLANREVRSTIAGTIVQGDLDELQGAPVEIGQNLFEVAPLDELVVEVEIPEFQYRYAKTGLPVRFTFEAYPYQQWDGTIQRLHPKAAAKESRNVFIAEVRLKNDDQLLRPGMKGQAKVIGGTYPLAWNWLHHPYEKFRTLIGWF